MFRRVSFPTLLIAWIALVILCVLATLLGGVAQAQTTYSPLPRNNHPLIRDDFPPGMIGSIQLQRKPELRGVWQAVELRCPDGVKVNVGDAGTFSADIPQPARLAVLVGAVYRLRLTGLPGGEDVELYPTLEIIDRTHPPAEREHRFPIPVELDETDLSDAAAGELITKVIYLEDSEIAEPVDTSNKPQRVLDIGAAQDALETADRMGRPVAILRIGSRVPNVSEGQDWERFLFGCPPWSTLKAIPTKQQLIEEGKWPVTARSGSISDRR